MRSLFPKDLKLRSDQRQLLWFGMVLGVLVLGLSLVSHAEEGGEGEGGGDGNQKKLSDAHIENEYKRLVLQMTQEESKVREARHRIQEMIKNRDESHNENEKAHYNKLMAEAHRKMVEANNKLVDIHNHMKYRFPEKDDESLRRYYPERVESLEQMEREVGLEAELTQLKVLIKKVYSVFLSEEFKAEQELSELEKQKKAERAPASEKENKKLRLVK